MSERNERQDQEFARRAKAHFDRSVQGIDGSTRSRLAQARARAVEAAGSRRLTLWPSGLIPVGGLAAAALAVALFVQSPEQPALEQAGMISDLDLLLEGENLELFEDLEFYAWLLEQPELSDTGESSDGSG